MSMMGNDSEYGERKIRLRIKKSTVSAVFSILLFRVMLDLSYYFIISRVWSHARFDLRLNNAKLIESYLLLLVVLALMPKSPRKLSNIMVWILVLLSYIPMLTFFSFADAARTYMYAATCFWLIVFIYQRISVPAISWARIKQSATIRHALLIGLGGTAFLLICQYLGLSFRFNLAQVYGIRREFVAAQIPLANYLFTWVAHVVNPIFFVLFIQRRKWLNVVFIVILQVLLFSATGNKVYLFALPFVAAMMWIVQRGNALAFMGIGCGGAVFLGIFTYWLAGDVWISALFAQRTLIIPAQLSFFYYDFFSNHTHVFLSNSIFRFFLDYPYHLSPSYLISEAYFNMPQMMANNGIVADAYMNFGLWGLGLWSALLAIILKLVDNCSKGVDPKVAVAAIAMPAIALTNMGPLTTLLTGGLLLALLFLCLLSSESNSRCAKSFM